MKTKLIATAAVLALSATIAIAAPEHGEHGGKRGERSEFGGKFAQKLNLTDAQKQQIDAIRKESRTQNAAFFQTVRQTREDFRAARKSNDTAKVESLRPLMESQRAQMQQFRDAERTRILAVLTPEQRAQYEQFGAERGQRHGHRDGHRKRRD